MFRTSAPFVPGIQPQYRPFGRSGGGGGIALVVSVCAGSANTTSVTTGNIDTTGCNLLVASVSSYELVGATTLTDSKGNTWTALTAHAPGTNGSRNAMFYCVPSSVGSGHNFSSNNGGDACFPSIFVAGFSGVGSFDQQSGAGTAGATSLQPGSLTPGADNGILITGVSGISDKTINSGFTIIDQLSISVGAYFQGALAYKIQTSAAAVNPTWSWSGSEYAATTMASFLP